ncbi:MAG: ATP-binding protein [Anaerolineae bacterium]
MTSIIPSSLRRFYPGVNTRVTVPFMLAIIAIAGIGIFTVTRLVAGSIQERFTNQLLDSAKAAVNTIADAEREQLAVLRQIVFTDGVARAVLAGETADLDTWLRPIAANHVVDELLLFDAAAEPVLHLVRLDTLSGVDYAAPPSPPAFAAWEGTRRVLAGDADALGDKFVDVIQSDGGTMFYFSAPVLDDNGDIVGGALLGLRAASLARQITEQSLASIAITDSSGQMMSSTFRGIDPALLELTPEEAAALSGQMNDSFSPVIERTLNNTPYQMMVARFQLRSEPIGLLSVGLPSNYVVEQSSTSRDIFGLVFGAFFIIVGILGLMVARSITRPISRLVSTTRAIREGDLSQRVQLAIPDELGELGISFDEMTDQLVSTNEEIRALYHVQVQQTHQREAILTSISDVVIVQDTQGRIILYNRAAGSLMQALSRNRAERDAFNRLCQFPEDLHQPQMASLADGHYSVLATPVQLETGELLGYVIVFRDITALIESEVLKDELVLQMSHELRTPLSAVRGFVDLVAMIDGHNLSIRSAEFIGKARDHLQTLERLVNQVVDVSAMIANRFDIHPEAFDLAELLQDRFEQWQPTMQARGHRLSLWTSTPELWVMADAHYIEEVLDYLLQNAHDYTLPGGYIAIHLEQQGTEAAVSVVDNGVGIAPEEQEQVFERMYRGRSAGAGETDARGLGLGLYMTRQIMEAHQGSVVLESEPGLGTTVTLCLPLKVAV